jgi:predicted phage terminase large subunit-like protein
VKPIDFDPSEEKVSVAEKKRREEQASRLGREALSNRLRSLPLLDMIPELTDHFRRPTHLERWCNLIERAESEPVRAMCSVPIRHGKTEATVHGIVWLLLKHPNWRIIFMTHSAEAAIKWGKRIRQLAEPTTIGPTKGWDQIAEWRNSEGGGVVVMSADQSKIGYDVDALVVDDPLDELHCNDPMVREAVDQAISMYTARCIKGGKRGPVLLVASRFHPDDPIGRRLTRTAVQWEYVHHAAITVDEDGDEHAFAPEVWPLDELNKTRAELRERDPSEVVWYAQFQNDPKPIGSSLFGPATFYTDLPTWHGWRVAHGVDFAYVDAPGSDFFAAVSARIYGRKLYIVDVQRHRLDATLLENTCSAIILKHGRGTLWSYQAGPEVGMSRLLAEKGIPVGVMHARYNKLVRAQKTIQRWNDGDILVPSPDKASWVNGFLDRLSLFRGHDKDRDDEVDALVSMCDAMLGGAPSASLKSLGITGKKPYPGFLG